MVDEANAHGPDVDEMEAAEEYVETRQSAGVPASLLEYLHACPVCEGAELRHYCRVPSLFNPGEYVHYERCARCRTVLRNPRLPPEYRLSRYEDVVLPDAAKQLQPKSQVHYGYMMELVRRHLPEGCGRRLFDFGCGAGGFLIEARKAGFEVMGLELNRDLAEFVERERGIPVHQGLISDPSFADERFDVVISSQVFEHLLDPRGTLADLAAHLRRPGLILIEVPNLRDLRERLRRGSTMNDSHLFYFTAGSLSRMLESQGFRVLAVEEGIRPWRFLSDPENRPARGPLAAGEKLLSALQVKTGLSVLAGW